MTLSLMGRDDDSSLFQSGFRTEVPTESYGEPTRLLEDGSGDAEVARQNASAEAVMAFYTNYIWARSLFIQLVNFLIPCTSYFISYSTDAIDGNKERCTFLMSGWCSSATRGAPWTIAIPTTTLILVIPDALDVLLVIYVVIISGKSSLDCSAICLTELIIS